jgi:hypothetical protein
VDSTEASRTYSTPWQIGVATILGGSLAGGFFARQNHLLLGAPKKATTISVISILVFIVAIVLGVLLPPRVPRSGGALLIAGAYRWYAEIAFSSQIAAHQSEGWSRQTWWRIIWVSVAILAGVFAVGLVGLVLFDKDAST